MRDGDPPHNWLKAPFYGLCATIGVVLVVAWAGRGRWVIAVFFAAYTVACLLALRLALSPRNPRWFRSFLDGRQLRRPGRSRRDP